MGGIFYGLDGAPEEDCVISVDASDCLFLADDFTQYWLGAYDRGALTAGGVTGTVTPLEGVEALFGGPATVDNPVNEAGALVPTSEILPVEEFPQFESWGAADYLDPAGDFIPIEGEWAAAATHIDDGYQRLSRTYDLTGIDAAAQPAMEAQFSFTTEGGYDHVIVEARVAGSEDWTTLPDALGGTTTEVPAECEAGFLLEEHPQLLNYLTPAGPGGGCEPTGTTGEWNSFTGSSGGWTEVQFDLTAAAGAPVEVAISYVTDPFTGEDGLIVDDTRLHLLATDEVLLAEGFEEGLGDWSVPGAPETSPGNSSDFERTRGLGGITAATATPDTLLFGFGLEQLATDADRAAVAARILAHFAG